MKNILKLIILLATLNMQAQITNKSDPFDYGLILPNATEETIATKIPVLDANLKMNTWISVANLLTQLQLETFSETGTRAGGDALTIIGDYDNSGNSTHIQIDDGLKKISLLTDTAKIIADDNGAKISLIAKRISIGTTDAHTLNSSVFKKITTDPLVGGELAINVSLLERNANPTETGYFYGSNNTITRSGTDAETGTKGSVTTIKKTGNFNSLVLYGQDLITELTGGGTTSYLIGQVLRVKALGTETLTVNGVARGQSADIEINNPNFTGYVQALHPTLNLKKGNITGGDLIYLDFDLDHADPDLNVTDDLTYLAGGSGEDVNAMATKLSTINKKFRFIHNTGILESDFGGIINYTGDVSNITNATNKVLINKEYLESLNYTNGIITGNTDAPDISNGTSVENYTTRQISAYEEELEFTNVPSQNAVALRIAPNFRAIVNGKVGGSSATNFTPTITYADGTALTYTTLVTSNYSVASDVVTFNLEVSGVTSNHVGNGIKVTGLPAPLNETTIVNCWLDLTGGTTVSPQGFYVKTGNILQTALANTNNLTRFIISGSYIKQ